jgi:DNA-binding MarR family transcriptional regulator
VDAHGLHRLARVLREIAIDAASDEGEQTSLSEVAVVEDVAAHPGTSIGEISKRTGYAQSLVSRHVAELRDAGVLSTAADPRDRRRQQVTLDPRARSGFLAERGSRPLHDVLRARFPDLSRREVDSVIANLNKVGVLLLE